MRSPARTPCSTSAQHDVIERVSWSSCSSQTRRLNSHKCFSELRFAATNWPQETHLNTIAFTTGLSDMTVSAYIIRVGRDGVQVSSWCLPAVVLVADFKNTNRSAAHSEIVAFFNSQPSSRRTAQVAIWAHEILQSNRADNDMINNVKPMTRFEILAVSAQAWLDSSTFVRLNSFRGWSPSTCHLPSQMANAWGP